MKKLLLILLFFICTVFYSQQVEFGLNSGISISNIVNPDKNGESVITPQGQVERVVIGKGLWVFNYGFNMLFYFKNPETSITPRVGLFYKTFQKGSVSEKDNINRIVIDTESIGLFGGVAGNIGNSYIIFLDVGIGFNSLDSNNFYEGTLDIDEAFPDFSFPNDFSIKSRETSFIFSIGAEKEIINNFKLFMELNGDMPFSKFNKGNGKLRNQSLGVGLGLKYILNFKK